MYVPAAPLPVISTPLLERRERGYLAWVAVANEIAELPLEGPPIDASPHALEIHVEGFDEPLVVLAEPTGRPTASGGFPLRLRPFDEAQEARLKAELFAGGAPHSPGERPPPRHLKTTATLPPPALTEEHTMALERTADPRSTLSRRAPGSLSGRTLGGGRFVLEQLLGGGASGEVYRALHTALRRPVAVKVLHPSLQQNQDYCARFYSEALAASRLDHRNVLRVIDYGQEPDGLLYIVMELLEGESLEQVLQREGRLPEGRIVELVSQACAGLGHAHDAGVVHRDIKPENIVVVRRRDDDGRETELVKVCDFGIAHWDRPPAREIDDEDQTLIASPDASKVVGTPAYMAPEQIQNEKVDARTDVYALGVVLYELATGVIPFLSSDPMEILTAHMVEPPAPPSSHRPELSAGLERVIMKALEKEPSDRHKDVRALRAELRGLFEREWASASGFYGKVSLRPPPLTAADFATDAAAALTSMLEIDAADLAASYAALTEALRAALLAGRAALARELITWVRARMEAPRRSEVEAALAERALLVLRDPDVARVYALHMLDGKVERGEAAFDLLRALGPLAARALVDARRVRPPSLEQRAQFVAVLRAVGASSLSVILSSLEPLSSLASRHEEALAEDLLRATPDVPSDAAGDVTVRFVRVDKPAVGVPALRATCSHWGPRAKPLLVGALDTEHDGFRALAIEELQRLGGVDDGVIERLARVLLGSGSDELKRAAAMALSWATPEARPRAVTFLVARLSPAQGFMSSLRTVLGPRDDPALTVALARALQALDPAGARPVLERAAAARPELRARLEAVLAGR